jgi:hypothetical protein
MVRRHPARLVMGGQEGRLIELIDEVEESGRNPI